MPDRLGVGRVDLVRIVAAAVQPPDVLVGQVRDHLPELRVLAEEVLAGVGAALGLEVLVLAVDRFLHALAQQPLGVEAQERVPVGAPDHLQHVPARPAERRLQLLDDLSVAAHRAVEPLEVAVDDEDEVVELLARGEGNGAERLRLVHLPVAHERPDLAPRGVEQPPVVQVLHEPRLVDGHDGPEPHRHRGELPEVGHEPRVGVRREPVAVDLLAEPVQVVLGDAALEEGAGVDPGSGVALHVDQVAAVGLVRRMPEVVEADVVEGRGGGEARDVAAELAREAVRLYHHRQRVPPDERADAPFDGRIAGGVLGTGLGNGVDVGGVDRERQARAALARVVHHRREEEVGTLDAVALDDGLERFDPVPSLVGVDVGHLRIGGHRVRSS